MAFEPSRFEGTGLLGTEDVDEYARLLSTKLPPGSAVLPAGVWMLLTDANHKRITETDERLILYMSRGWFQLIGQADMVYVPILYSSHWILATINYSTRIISMYNSLRTYSYDEKGIHDNLQRLASFLKPTSKDVRFKFVVDDEGCEQKDSYNCGIHVLQRIRSNVLGDVPSSIPIDELRLHLKNELILQDIILFQNVIIVDLEKEEDIFSGLQTYYLNNFETVEQLAYPSSRRLGVLRVNQPVKDSPSYIIKFSLKGRNAKLEEAFRISTSKGIKIFGLVLGSDQKFMGILEEDK